MRQSRCPDDRPEHRAILRRYKELLRTDLPIHVVVRPGQDLQYGKLLNSLKVWTHIPFAGDLDALAAEVEAAEEIA